MPEVRAAARGGCCIGRSQARAVAGGTTSRPRCAMASCAQRWSHPGQSHREEWETRLVVVPPIAVTSGRHKLAAAQTVPGARYARRGR